MFANVPPTDFSLASEREAYQRALTALDHEISSSTLRAAPIIDGKELTSGTAVDSIDPAEPSTVIGRIHFATTADAERALAALSRGAPSWEATAARDRAAKIASIGALMRDRRMDLAALITREGGKPWREADADVAEAIDFCFYYAEQMREMGTPRLTQKVPGEDNHYFYQPRGIAVVIAPWNFPLAIACGMTVAALVTGNATVLKPAEQTSLIAYRFARMVLEAGVPPSAFAFLPGVGEDVGRALVESPLTDMICFTGSKSVGLEIISKAAQVIPGQRGIKKVVAELGGKNAIIIDEDADLDEAVKGVIYSAFGFAGQKCSACSRAIVVGSAYEPFLSRLVDATGDLIVGAPKDPATFLGPVIDEVSHRRIMATIERASKEHTVAFRGATPTKEGYFVPATIFRDVPASATLWREEIFGPVLACRHASNFDEALALANDSQYALTGGIFSRSPANIERAKREFKVGNLYINRGCTGAIVCRHPFGGFRMSGVGSKAGGPDYLVQFMEPRVVSENTMRRGFAPETV